MFYHHGNPQRTYIKVHAVQYHEVYKKIITFQKSLSIGFPENLERIK